MTSKTPALQGFRVRLLADKSDPAALHDDLPGAPRGTWPRAGVVIEGETLTRARAPMSWVLKGIAEGWLEGEGHQVVTRPAGTAEAPWQPTENAPTPHVFHHYDVLVLKTIEGDLRYRVTHQPDKYADPAAANDPSDTGGLTHADDDTPVTDDVYTAGATRVDWYYDVELEA